jgi:hypothetical protein
MLALDVRQLQRNRLLKPGASFNWGWTRNGQSRASINIQVEANQVMLRYRQRQHGDHWQDMAYPVLLDWTPCHYGGQRAWWLCPAVGCGRRVALLFGGTVFACRHCHELTYQSQRETADMRAIRRADKLRDRMDWTPGILTPPGGKPKGMHWQTFERLRAAHDQQALQGMSGMMERIDRQQQRVDDFERKMRRR